MKNKKELINKLHRTFVHTMFLCIEADEGEDIYTGLLEAYLIACKLGGVEPLDTTEQDKRIKALRTYYNFNY